MKFAERRLFEITAFAGQQLFCLALLLLCCRALGADDLQQAEEAAFKAATAVVAPSVVRIETFGGQEKVGNVLVGAGPTTGLIVSDDGYILSSAFNFAQKPSSILVTLPGGKRAAAQIVARDHSRMLVLLKVATSDKLPVPIAVPREEMSVGQWTLAVGRTFDQAEPNVSLGVLSAKQRIWGKAIQCDAKISPSNYGGPLVDLHGHVLGLLVPMSPQGEGETAGAEWYDSGIGFAVPLAELMPRLEKLKQGEDLFTGLLGISLKGNDLYNAPATIVACQPNGPAAKAGLLAQDTIIAIDGQPIVRQAQLKHALGPKYAGDRVHVVVLRSEQRKEFDIELVDRLEPYQHAFLGVLPSRDEQATPGVLVRYVYADSPAAEAGLQIGDTIIALGPTDIKDAAALAEALAATQPGQQVAIKIRRDNNEQSVQATLGGQPLSVPKELPRAHAELAAAENRPAIGTIEIKLPEEKNSAVGYIPTNYHPKVAHGLLLMLCEPGKFDRDEVIGRYKSLCDQHDIILILARPTNGMAWDAGDAAFLRKTIDDVIAHYNVDRNRIAVGGYQTSGTMAYFTAFTNSDLIRAVIAIEAVLPQRLKPPENEPARRWSIYTSLATRSPQRSGIEANIKSLQAMKYPVVVHSTGQDARDLTTDELKEVGRWLDSLDRL